MSLKYRHEWKHVLNTGDLHILRQRLKAVMESDPHAIDGRYMIRSLYFDNTDDKALREKIDGVNMREKFRIRLYNYDPSVIHLEKKSKRNGLGTKYSAGLSADEAQRIVDGDIGWMMDPERPLLQELYCKMRYQGIRPIFANHKDSSNPYIVVISCDGSKSERDATEYLSQNTRKCTVKSKTARKGNVELNVEVRLKDDNTDFINVLADLPGVHNAVLCVTNECDYIAPEKTEHLFDRLFRLDEARNSEGHHYGLGLSIAKAVAQKYAGKISVTCRYRVGGSFFILTFSG